MYFGLFFLSSPFGIGIALGVYVISNRSAGTRFGYWLCLNISLCTHKRYVRNTTMGYYIVVLLLPFDARSVKSLRNGMECWAPLKAHNGRREAYQNFEMWARKKSPLIHIWLLFFVFYLSISCSFRSFVFFSVVWNKMSNDGICWLSICHNPSAYGCRV